jgi:hypothetical protein
MYLDLQKSEILVTHGRGHCCKIYISSMVYLGFRRVSQRCAYMVMYISMYAIITKTEKGLNLRERKILNRNSRIISFLHLPTLCSLYSKIWGTVFSSLSNLYLLDYNFGPILLDLADTFGSLVLVQIRMILSSLLNLYYIAINLNKTSLIQCKCHRTTRVNQYFHP